MLAVRDGKAAVKVRRGSSGSRCDVEVVDEKVQEGDKTVLEMVQTGKKRKSSALSPSNKEPTTSKRKPSTSGTLPPTRPCRVHISELKPAPKDPYKRVVSSVTPSKRLLQRRSKEQAQTSLIVKPVKQKQAPVKQRKDVKRLKGKGKKTTTPDRVLKISTAAQELSTAVPESVKIKIGRISIENIEFEISAPVFAKMFEKLPSLLEQHSSATKSE